jgi:hypothetical protein
LIKQIVINYGTLSTKAAIHATLNKPLNVYTVTTPYSWISEARLLKKFP